MKFLYPFAILFLLLNSCSPEKEINYSQPVKGKCNSDNENIYHYSLPQQYEGSLPLLIILDSGGDGLMAVNKTIPALTNIPCLVIGSDLIRNNFPGFERAITVLIDDACSKFPVSKDKVVLAGFSGGARMAFEYARKHRVMGVMMCGAGPSMNQNEQLPCPVWMIAGTTDFNFRETFYNPLNSSGQQEFLADYFSGSHEWPPADLMKDACLFLMGKSAPDGKSLLKQESAFLSEKADSILLNKGSTFFALKAVEKAILLNPGNRKAEKQFQEIKGNAGLAGKIRRIESDLQQESRINQSYSQASMERDSIWWTKEIQKLSLVIDESRDEQKDHFLRIKGFLGILFYSRLNTMIAMQPDNPQISHLLAAYRMAEPGNPDVYYDYALYEWKKGNEQVCKKNLRKALSLGFRDSNRISANFPPDFLNN
jgi:hypothetical protein